MATKPKLDKPTVFPEVDPELYDIIQAIYARWTPQEFANAVWQYRRAHDLIQSREAKQTKIKQLQDELDNEE